MALQTHPQMDSHQPGYAINLPFPAHTSLLKMKIKTIFLLLALLSFNSFADTMQDKLDQFSSFSQQKCVMQKIALDIASGRNTTDTKKKDEEVATIQSQAKLACECIPGKIEKVRAERTKDELKTKISNDAFVPFIKQIDGACAAQLMREIFSSPSCPQRAEKETKSNPNYCACMSRQLSKLSDDDFYEMSIAAYADFKAKVKARTDGLPDPVKSEWGKRNDSMNQQCMTQDKSAD